MRVETESDLLFRFWTRSNNDLHDSTQVWTSAQVIRGFTNEGPIYLQHIVAPYYNNRRPGLVRRDELLTEM